MPSADRSPLRRRRFRLGALLTGAATALVATFGAVALPATADPIPAAPAAVTDPATVTADALPTWQINGVVWSQAVVGNTVYVTGSFTKARPPGVAVGGAGEVDATNIFAYDITTGNPVPFPHSLNAQGLVIRANPAGTRIYVGGDFTTVDGQVRQHIAAFDTATGSLVEGFQPHTDGQVRGFGFAGSTVYVGGNFRSADGQPRNLLAAFNNLTGAMTSWSPTVEGGYVWSMVLSPDASRVIVSGSFVSLNGVGAYGMGALNATSGATEAWAANARIRSAGDNGAISSLNTDGTQIYGTGYAFGAGASFEGTFAADPYTGDIKWVNDCLGDTYDIFPMGQVAYSVSHHHNCTVVGGFPDTSPRSRWQKALAERTYPVGTITKKDAYGWDFTGLPYSGQLHWYPDLEFGSYTASRQAAWSITGNSDYVVLGGEFPMVNGVAQQGLVRFTKRPNLPHAKGPINNTAFTPAPSSTESGKVRVVFGSVWDRDDANITYDVYRSPSTKLATFTRNDSEFWQLPTLGFTDQTTPGASVRYQVRATDSDGNVQWSAWSPYHTVSSAATSPYAAAVRSSGASHYWRLGETTGPTLLDDIGDLHGTNVGTTTGTAGALTGQADASVTSPGGSTAKITTKDAGAADAATTVEAWVKTTSIRGGRIVGFGDSAAGTSAVTDRVLYLDPSGRANFAINDTSYRTIYSRYPINDGQWHHVAGVVDANGMQLFVDGVRVGRDQNYNALKSYSGYWRIGADQTTGFANKPTDAGLAGSFDEIAVYPKGLTKAEIQAHYTVSGRSGSWSTAPTDTYGAEVAGDSPDLFWRLGESSGAALDSSSSGAIGNVSGTVTRNQTGPIAANPAMGFDGLSGLITANQAWAAPSSYSAELWFKTSSIRGGKLIGFGNAVSGLSSSYDRHLTMYSNGKLSFGSYNGVQNSLVTTDAYNDAQWHHVVASQGASGMRLWVDARLVGTNAVATVSPYLGYWRVGGDRTWGNTLSNFISGSVDEVAVYPRVLGEQDVRDHFGASGRAALNRPPVAAFTTSVDNLVLRVDGSSSTDPDGPVSYAWNFGDGSTGTGVTATHTYARAGTFTVTLTVTDADGATSTVTHDITAVAASNQAPQAGFTAQVDDLSVSVDGTSSTDPDGSVASYAWDFGDGGSGTGATASHTYAVAGSYDVTLTVTDDHGATGSLSKPVTATASTVFATDAFGRSITSGWGVADRGGSWTIPTGSSRHAVGNGVGTVNLVANSGSTASLSSVSSSETQLKVSLSLDKPATGGGQYASLIGRQVAGADYRAKIRVNSTGSVSVWLVKMVGSTETVFTSTTVTGLTYAVGDTLNLELQVTGTNATSLKAKAWLSTSPEPTAWTLTATDSTAALQAPGSVGLYTFLSGSTTNGPVTFSYDNLVVGRPQ